MSASAPQSDIGERLERIVWGNKSNAEAEGESVTEQRIAKVEAKLEMLQLGVDKLTTAVERYTDEARGSMHECRERCDTSRGALYDRIREIEGEQRVNRGAHEQIATEKARHPHVHVAGATYAVFAITAILVLVEIIKIWKG